MQGVHKKDIIRRGGLGNALHLIFILMNRVLSSYKLCPDNWKNKSSFDNK